MRPEASVSMKRILVSQRNGFGTGVMEVVPDGERRYRRKRESSVSSFGGSPTSGGGHFRHCAIWPQWGSCVAVLKGESGNRGSSSPGLKNSSQPCNPQEAAAS